ncbi:cytochrome c biogenesis heme-transporting ATPase CcmA [Colwellia sp. MB3u-22]|nr:cytochrome c biogenesis heme-transporting ATPase CcmA [Colwellia sp. MB02u-7]MBA6234544.1 cytochrome c biogenesis heme-transporting ATPase CcmA [Colwellia sp. MB02u-11]MBA6301098.1 cytochrome c biogenesis heme-transporting ATPase CcmA [Colwellia sp. MB3u-22]MBA6309923.1 cytochrome c biogenesis heme-transporting ATPase CcmA [Colwellia sp. MB3u-64]
MQSSNNQVLLSANGLTCIREDRVLFEALNFSVFSGNIIQVEGPNGSGKTSLLRILAGLSQPYDGTVLFREQNITEQSDEFHQNILYIGHLPGVKGEITAQENLEFTLALHGNDVSTAEETLEKVNLLGFENALASHLSAGQHRRISLARLWQSTAPIWILDEPFTAIDKRGVEKLEQLFLAHAQRGGCVILTTHQDLSFPEDKVKKITLDYRFY